MNKTDIIKHLTQAFDPIHLDVIDESDQHRGHRGTPHTENTHFHVIIVAKAFDGMPLIQRHRSINKHLKSGFLGTLHALKITAHSPEEWAHRHA